jgi:hypothetical protein
MGIVKAAFVVLSLLAAGHAHADRIKVAVVPGIAVNLDSARVDALSQDLANALVTELDIDAVGGLEVRRQLPAEGVPADCFTTKACVDDVAKRLGANQLLFVVMVDATGSGAVQVDSTWVDVASGKNVSRPAVDLPSINDAKPRFAAAATQLLPDAPVRPKKSPGGGMQGSMSKEVPRHFTPLSYATAGVGVVGIGLGVVLGLSARSKFNACEESQACGDSERDTIRTRTIIADTGFVLGIAGIVTTSILFATSGKESRLVVSPTTDGVAVSAFGRF